MKHNKCIEAKIINNNKAKQHRSNSYLGKAVQMLCYLAKFPAFCIKRSFSFRQIS